MVQTLDLRTQLVAVSLKKFEPFMTFAGLACAGTTGAGCLIIGAGAFLVELLVPLFGLADAAFTVSDSVGDAASEFARLADLASEPDRGAEFLANVGDVRLFTTKLNLLELIIAGPSAGATVTDAFAVVVEA